MAVIISRRSSYCPNFATAPFILFRPAFDRPKGHVGAKERLKPSGTAVGQLKGDPRVVERCPPGGSETHGPGTTPAGKPFLIQQSLADSRAERAGEVEAAFGGVHARPARVEHLRGHTPLYEQAMTLISDLTVRVDELVLF